MLGERREKALLFRRLATLRRDAPLFHGADELRWRGPTDAFDALMRRIDAPKLVERTVAAYTQLWTESPEGTRTADH